MVAKPDSPDQEEEEQQGQQNEGQVPTNMIRINFSVPAGLYDQIMQMAAFDGLKAAELNRYLWMNGVDNYVESLNKRLVNQKLLTTALAKSH